jgi:hypothetical protein
MTGAQPPCPAGPGLRPQASDSRARQHQTLFIRSVHCGYVDHLRGGARRRPARPGSAGARERGRVRQCPEKTRTPLWMWGTKNDKKIYQEGLYTLQGKTYQMITEKFLPAPHCTYKGKTLLNNRYSFYDESSHSFSADPNNQKSIDDDQWLQKCNEFIAAVPNEQIISQPRGVIICAADRHFVCSYLTIQLLLQQDPKIQIEYYYVDGELPEFQKNLLKSIENIELINCLEVIPQWFPTPITKSHLQGPMIKSFALMVSKFDEILLLTGNFPNKKLVSGGTRPSDLTS